MERDIFTLFQVARSIQKTINERYRNPYWIKAELNKLNYYKQSGHCFPELVDKQDGKIVAQMKATIWKDDFIQINSKFLSVLKEPLKDGIKILFLASISFEPGYGLSLHIIDVDPSFTLGDLEREKQETIKKLQQEELFAHNKKLRFPLLPQRIAIISDVTSKGYADFLKVIGTNGGGYKLFHMLFPSLLQGERAVPSIISQLRRIRKVSGHFDVVAIVRGGGDDIGLSCFNNYRLAREVALFPVPVITGIGHATNETVTELISYYNAITPTKLAEFLLQIFANFEAPVLRAEERIMEKANRVIGDEKQKLKAEVKLFIAGTGGLLNQNRSEIRLLVQSLFQQSIFRFKTEKTFLRQFAQETRKATDRQFKAGLQKCMQLQAKITSGSLFYLKNSNADLINMERSLINMSPENVLRRGYSITTLHGKAIKNFQEVKTGDKLDTILFDGNITSVVSTAKNTTHE